MKVEEGLVASNDGLAKIGRPREFGKKQQNPMRRYGGIAVALILHIVLIYALVNGLATKVVQIVQQPIETRIIEPVKPPPPPPKPVTKIVSQPKVAPPPPFVPPPEVPVQSTQPTISHVATPMPSAPAVQAPPVAPAKPVSHEVGVVCPNSDEIRSTIAYPKEAQENNITGDVTIDFTVDPSGQITNERVSESADPSLDRAAFNAVKQFHCIGQGQAVRVQVPFSFNLN
jgi:periplasmic protein TonB